MSNQTYSSTILKGGPLVRWQRFARFRIAAKYMQRYGANNTQHLLDLGAADGIGMPFWQPLFREITCLNYYENHARQLQGNYPHCISITADARQIPLANELFDFVVSLETLHCIPNNRIDAIKEAYRVLKPGGHFIFSVPIEVGYTAIIKYLSRAVTGHALAEGMKPSMALKHVFPKWFNVAQYDTGRQIGFDAYHFRQSVSPYFNVLITKTLPLKIVFPFNLMVVCQKKEFDK